MLFSRTNGVEDDQNTIHQVSLPFETISVESNVVPRKLGSRRSPRCSGRSASPDNTGNWRVGSRPTIKVKIHLHLSNTPCCYDANASASLEKESGRRRREMRSTGPSNSSRANVILHTLNLYSEVQQNVHEVLPNACA